MMNLKWYRLILVGAILVLTTNCSQFTLLASGASFAASQNSLVKIYNATDFGVVLTTKKGIKTHVYEKGKKYIYDNTVGLVHKH